jgi:glycosyltransferase involved in cell wall biosynthesis
VKYAFVCNEYPLAAGCGSVGGGIGTFVQTTARAFASEGHDVSVVGFDEHGAQAGERNDLGVRVVTLARARGLGPLRRRLDRRTLRRWLLDGSFDRVEVPDFGGMLPFLLDACSVVVRLHRSHGLLPGPTPPWLRRCERATLCLHRNWVALDEGIVSETMSYAGVEPDSVEIEAPLLADIPEGPSPFEGRYVLYVGTVSREKGVFDLAEAMKPLLAEDPDLKLIFMGRIAAEGTAAEGISVATLTGARPHEEVLRAMRGAAVFAFPSAIESYGLVVDEAMKAGAPVVTLDLPLFRRRVRPGEDGLLVPPGDVSALREAIRSLLAFQPI